MYLPNQAMSVVVNQARHTFAIDVHLSYLIERYLERTYKSFMFLPEGRTAPHKISLRRVRIPQRVRIIPVVPPFDHFTQKMGTQNYTPSIKNYEFHSG